MKRTYIKPGMAIQKIEACTIMVGSNNPSASDPTMQEVVGVRSFSEDQMYYKDNLEFKGDAGDDVTPSSKDHDMWDDVLE